MDRAIPVRRVGVVFFQNLAVFSIVKGMPREKKLSKLKLPAVRLRRTTGNALAVAFSATFMPRFVLPRLLVVLKLQF